MPRLLSYCWTFIGLTGLSIGCSSSAPPQAGPAAPTATATEPGAEAKVASEDLVLGDSVTSGEYYDAALAVENAILLGDAAAFDALLDVDALGAETFRGIDIPQKQKDGYVRGFRNAVGALSTKLIGDGASGGTYRLLRVHKRRGQHKAVFRLHSDSGLNYHELLLGKDAQGAIKVIDIYVMLSGERFSQTLRRMVLPFIAHENRNVVERLMKSESDYVSNAPRVQRMHEAINAGNPEQALAEYRQLPQSLKDEKTLLIFRMLASQRTENWEEYRAAVADFNRVYPNDSAIDLIGLDVLIVDKKFDEAIATLQRMDKAVGGDPFLHTTRSTLLQLKGDLPAAKEAAQLAIEDPSAIPHSYWQLITITLAQQDHAETLKYLVAVEQRYELQMGDLTTVPEYAEFVKSPQYQQWLARQ